MPSRILFSICLVLGLISVVPAHAASTAELKTRMFDLAQKHHVAAGCKAWDA